MVNWLFVFVPCGIWVLLLHTGFFLDERGGEGDVPCYL